jgi:tryptophan synthase alpha chain
VLEIVAAFRARDDRTPLLLMGYANPVEHMGYAAFADQAAAAGVDALLTVDIPPEEVSRVNVELRRVGMDNIFLIAPTTPPAAHGPHRCGGQRLHLLRVPEGRDRRRSSGPGGGRAQLEEIRRHTALPVCVGFGIKDGPSAAAVAAVADGVVIGSALVQRIADVAAGGGERAAMLHAAKTLIGEIREHVDALQASPA